MHGHVDRRRGSTREALTLIEVVIAVGILSVILLGMFSAMASAQQADRLTRERAAASEAAFNVMDELLTGGVDSLDPLGYRLLTFPVEVNTGAGTANLRPARAYPTTLWTLLALTPPAPVSEPGVAVAYQSSVVDVGSDGAAAAPDGGNTEMMEVRVMVAWRSADGSDQRFEVVSRRMR